MKKVLVRGAMAAVLLLGTALVYALTYKPEARPVTDLRIEATPERMERGRYLVESTVGCLECHTERDETQRTAPATGPLGAGGRCLTGKEGFPGTVCPPNLTPDPETGIGNWSDDELLRAMRDGIGRDGRALFPIMPYEYYRHLSDEDAYAVIAYLRTLEPVRKEHAASQIDFPVSFFIARLPEPVASPVVSPTPADGPLAYGRHLTFISGCVACHGEDLSGGKEFPIPTGQVRSSNLTPDPTGIVPEEFDDFLRMFRAYADGSIPGGTSQKDLTVMPWMGLSQMSDDDLRAIHTYLRSLPPVAKQIQTYGQ